MSNFQILCKIIHPKFMPDDQSTLIESKGDGKPMKLEVSCKKRNEKYYLYKFDPDKETIFPFFSRESGLQKICDYIVLVNKDDILYILLVELKRGPKSSKKQLEASKCFIEYIINTAERIGECINRKDIFIRTIRICATNIVKNTTKINMDYINDHLDYRWNKFIISSLLH